MSLQEEGFFVRSFSLGETPRSIDRGTVAGSLNMGKRTLALGLVLVSACMAFLGLSAQAEGATWAKRVTGYLPTADGTELKYSALLPAETGEFPVILNYSGYDPGSIGGSAYEAGNTTMDKQLDDKLLAAGYAVVGVNMAGTACSEGVFDLFAPRWGTDGRDAVEWIADQSWSNGDVGMANWSYAVLSQLFTAEEQPPHLKAIAPGMSVTDPWRDNGTPGGVEQPGFANSWWFYIQSRWTPAGTSATAEGDQRCLDNIAANRISGQALAPGTWYTDPIKRRPEGAFGLERNRSNFVDQIEVPVMSMISWQDESTGSRQGYFEEKLDPETTYMVGTNGPHNMYTNNRWQDHMIRFFDHYVNGEDNGFDEEPRVQLWQETTSGSNRTAQPGEVITDERLPVEVDPLRFSLHADGSMTSEPAAAGEQGRTYSYPTPGPRTSQWATAAVSPTGSTSFTTPKLADDLTFYGPASLDMWVSSSTAPDADIQATITEVRPDGSETYIQRGWLRLSDRAQDPLRSSELLPYQKLTSAAYAPLTDDQPVLGRLEIYRFSHIFREGSSIRVVLDAPSNTGGWSFRSPTDPTTIKIHTDPEHPSSLVFGLLRRGGVDSPLPACGSVVSETCRTNTIPVPEGTEHAGDDAPSIAPRIVTAPDASTTDTSATFTFEFGQGDTLGAGLECSLDGDAFEACGTEGSAWSSKSYSGLDVGDHTFEVRSMNARGSGPVSEHEWSVTATAPEQRTLTVTKSGAGTGAVSGAAGAIDCGTTCAVDLDEGTQVTLTATPESGSTFTGWIGGGCSGTGDCQVTLGGDREVVATFGEVVEPGSASIQVGAVQPKSPKVNAGGAVTVLVTVNNTGTADATGVKVCATVPRKAKSTVKAPKCANVGTVGAGSTKVAMIKVKTTKKAKGSARIALKVSSANAGTGSTAVNLKIKKRK